MKDERSQKGVGGGGEAHWRSFKPRTAPNPHVFCHGFTGNTSKTNLTETMSRPAGREGGRATKQTPHLARLSELRHPTSPRREIGGNDMQKAE